MPSTYTPIATANGTGSSGTITFSSIPSTYTDLFVSMVFQGSVGGYIKFRVNNLSTSIYSFTQLYGTGSVAASARVSNQTESLFEESAGPSFIGNAQINFQNYANTNINKSYLLRCGDAQKVTRAIAGLVRTTAAINRLDFFLDGNFTTASTITLYGIAAA
jgi:hypothetical protein